MATKRNYRKEYDNYHKRPKQIEGRGSRNKARAIMAKRGWYIKVMAKMSIIQAAIQ